MGDKPLTSAGTHGTSGTNSISVIDATVEDSSGQLAFYGFGDGVSAGVSASGAARLRYNDTAKELQLSIDAGSYAAVGVGAADDANIIIASQVFR